MTTKTEMGMAEIEQVLSVGVSPSNVIFSNTTKAAGHLRHARIKGVELMTFDNEAELKKVHSIFPTAKLLLRLRCAPTDCRVVFSHKFGCSPQEAPLLLRAARALGLRVVGVSFHLGSDSRSPLAYESGIEAARHVFEEGRRQGWRMRVLDIGGGFPGDEGTSLHQVTIDKT
ncbi:hypothetical protein ANN_08804 [Periplaneta americana]|uniref:Orn/DAP/Arg decarboxylase 2 N-terminal domain-containing protein n=1 Tax=Periplaneta americana TaxID=6978 RepID=A0ABQ8T430_PERAM|nr:hypothetical protein ANN_08804 [Periplaneta americana]